GAAAIGGCRREGRVERDDRRAGDWIAVPIHDVAGERMGRVEREREALRRRRTVRDRYTRRLRGATERADVQGERPAYELDLVMPRRVGPGRACGAARDD